jgi:hypothetical protein
VGVCDVTQHTDGVTVMSSDAESREAMEIRDPFIDGYFAQRIKSGERPKYGYPTNHLPETTGARMEVRTSFMVSRKPKK